MSLASYGPYTSQPCWGLAEARERDGGDSNATLNPVQRSRPRPGAEVFAGVPGVGDEQLADPPRRATLALLAPPRSSPASTVAQDGRLAEDWRRTRESCRRGSLIIEFKARWQSRAKRFANRYHVDEVLRFRDGCCSMHLHELRTSPGSSQDG